MMRLESFCVSAIGKRRSHEDNFLIGGRHLTLAEQREMTEKRSISYADKTYSNVRFFAVSDGMGGHSAGEVASHICVAKLAALEPTVQNCSNIKDVVALCQKTISDINADVCKKSGESLDYKGMGATLVLFIMLDSDVAVLNLGDSRAYFYDGANLEQITKDNTEEQRMLDLNLLTPDEVAKFPARKNLNRYVGFNEPGIVLKAEEYYTKARKGIFLLCSDGVSDSLNSCDITQHLRAGFNSQTTAQKIVDHAIEKDGSDNATLVIISVKG